MYVSYYNAHDFTNSKQSLNSPIPHLNTLAISLRCRDIMTLQEMIWLKRIFSGLNTMHTSSLTNQQLHFIDFRCGKQLLDVYMCTLFRA